MTTTYEPAQPGRFAALLVYGLYILSIPSFGVFALAGVILAIMSREGADPLTRAHLDEAIGIWFTAFWWAVGLAILTLFGWILSFILVGIPLLAIAWVAGLLVGLWFTVKSILGLLKLLDNRRP